MDSDYHVQFCDREANQDITSWPSAESDATEIRLWSADSTLIVAVELNMRSKRWHVSASDVYSWTTRTRAAHDGWRHAMLYARPSGYGWHDDIERMLKSAGY